MLPNRLAPTPPNLDLVEHPLKCSTNLVNLRPDPPFWWIRSTVEMVELEVFGKKKWIWI